MPSLSDLNEENTPALLQHGVAGGSALAIEVSTVLEHVHSRAATIFKAQSTKHGDVAIKVIFAPDVREPHDLRKEVRLMTALSHPNICPLLNAYYIESHYVLAMPYYNKTLQDLLDDSTFVTSTAETAFKAVARSLIKQMCSAVAYLEEQQIAHRDISPPNFLLSSNGTVALTDFGVAWSAENTGSEGTTNLYFELGTGPYRAPELLFGSHAYDPLALDKWSLGVAIASFFTHIGPTRLPSPDSDEEQYTPSFMKYVSRVGPVKRKALFEGGFSDFALIGSIFKIMGTPTLDTWPEAKDLPDFGKFTYKHFPPQELETLLPNLPSSSASSSESPAELVGQMLRYSFKERLGAQEALKHPWLQSTALDLATLPASTSSWFT